MIVAVPTYRRHSNGQAQTLVNWPRALPLRLFVREEEWEAYAALVHHLGRDEDEIVVMPEGSVACISDTRNFMVSWAREHGHEKVLMVDDDLHFIVRGKVPGDDVHLRECDPSDIRQLLAWMEQTLSHYTHAAVSMREGNNRVPGLGASVQATRGIRMVGYNVRELPALGAHFRREVDGREDLDMTLQLLSRGRPNVVTYHWAQGQKIANAPGGLSEYRDVAHSDASARKLAELWPDFVKLRAKHATSAGEFGERIETIIYWKRALQSARQG